MEIIWYGHSCFRFTERGMATVVTDPYNHDVVGYTPLKLKADIVTVSHDVPSHNYIKAVKGESHLINAPGEYEIGGVFITGVQTSGHGKNNNHKPRNLLFDFDYESITIAHLGDMDRIPSQTEIENLGTVDIALIPVGGGGGLTAASAVEVISLLEPGIVIPMHYHLPGCKLDLDPLSKFLKGMGVSEQEALPSLKITSSAIPQETKVIVLELKQS